MYIEKPVIRSFRFPIATGGDSSIPTIDIPLDYTYLVGFTLGSGNDTEYSNVSQGLIGIEGLYIDEEKILDRYTPIRLIQAQEVCYDCKFFPCPIENYERNKLKINGSLFLPNIGSPTVEVVLSLLMTNKKPQFNVNLEEYFRSKEVCDQNALK